MVIQESGTTYRVTWTPPPPLGDTTGYVISYTSTADSNGTSITISGGSTNSYTLTGLDGTQLYTIYIVGTSEHIPSEAIAAQVLPSKA